MLTTLKLSSRKRPKTDLPRVAPLKVILLLVCVFFSFGCPRRTMPQDPSSFDRAEDCRQFLRQLDKRVERAGVRDASSSPIPGFPYFRTDRFLTALKNTLKTDQAREQWLELMQRLDLGAREKEIFNLPEHEVFPANSVTAQAASRKDLNERVKICSETLLARDRARSGFLERLHSHIEVPDEYSSILRIAGLYPLMSIPVAVVSEQAREKIRTRFTADLHGLPIIGALRTYTPARRGNLSQVDIEDMIARWRDNPLRIPLISESQEIELAAFFAPVLIQDVAAAYDIPGQVVYDGKSFTVDFKKPTIYYYTSHAFLHQRPTLQINYVIWYSERAGKTSPLIERGHLDGLTMRVSLDDRGRVFMADIMNNCGCYHFFIPRKDKVLRVNSAPFTFDPLVPQWLSPMSCTDHLGIRVNSGWHQVQRQLAVGDPAGSISYELLPYRTLESLPDGRGYNASLFDAEGIVKGSGRIEPLLLFSMGVPSIGSMRQRGHHAIELIGQAHFDDPYLIERNFVLK